jgi:hypothetical protein
LDKNHDQLSPACAIAGRLVLVAPVHPPSSRTANAAGRCRSFRTLPVFVLPWIEEVPFGANFVLGCSFPYSCLLKAAARSTVDFPRRCPFSGIVRVPFRDEEFAVISRYFKSRYRDFAPNPCGSRYQTAGSIGALARDEPVTPGVTFLSHPAPNSEDLNDR